jgi:hypothetical protein
MSYCSTSEVYAACKLDDTVVPEATVTAIIKSAEKQVDRFTYTTYWSEEDSGTATAGDDAELTDDTQSWDDNAYANMYAWIHSGTGSGQIRKISSNTSDTLTLDRDWSTNPDDTSEYRIIYAASDPYFSDSIDGTGTATFFAVNYPIRLLESLSIDDTSVTTTNVFIYTKQGKLQLSEDAEERYFLNSKPQQVDLAYWFGVYPLPEEVKRYTIVCAAMGTLAAQTGGTYATPSTYSLPEGSVTVGQAYVNIRETFNMLKNEKEALERVLEKYGVIM